MGEGEGPSRRALRESPGSGGGRGMDARALAGFEARAAEAERRLEALERGARAGAAAGAQTPSQASPLSAPLLSPLSLSPHAPDPPLTLS